MNVNREELNKQDGETLQYQLDASKMCVQKTFTYNIYQIVSGSLVSVFSPQLAPSALQTKLLWLRMEQCPTALPPPLRAAHRPVSTPRTQVEVF